MLAHQGRCFGETLYTYARLMGDCADGMPEVSVLAQKYSIPWLEEFLRENQDSPSIQDNSISPVTAAAAASPKLRKPATKKRTVASLGKKKRTAAKSKPVDKRTVTVIEDKQQHLVESSTVAEDDEDSASHTATEAARTTDAEKNWEEYIFH